MIRFLLLLGLIYLLYLILTRPLDRIFGGRPRNKFGSKDQRPKSGPKKPLPDAEEMVACALCGTFIARRAGEVRDGKLVCKPQCHT